MKLRLNFTIAFFCMLSVATSLNAQYGGPVLGEYVSLSACTTIDLDKDSMKTVYEKFGLEPGTHTPYRLGYHGALASLGRDDRRQGFWVPAQGRDDVGKAGSSPASL